MIGQQELRRIWAPRVLTLVRVVAALIMLEHGMQKLFNFPAANGPGTALLSLHGVAGLIEFFGGGLLILGAFTGPVAFILSGEMAFAYFISHFPRALFPVVNGGDLAIVFCFLFLYLAAAGGGAWSIDRLRERHQTNVQRARN